MLHIVNKSHAQTLGAAQLPAAGPAGIGAAADRGRRLCRHGRGAATSGVAEAVKSLKVYALQPDVDARGMAGKLIDGVTAVDYGGFVDLVAEHNTPILALKPA